MASFQQLYESLLMKDKTPPPKAHEDDNKKIAAIKIGLNTRSDNKDGKTFWDDFIQVCGDAESLSHLLGVNKHIIAGWNKNVKKYLKVVKDEMEDDNKKSKRNNMINTGDKP